MFSATSFAIIYVFTHSFIHSFIGAHILVYVRWELPRNKNK